MIVEKRIKEYHEEQIKAWNGRTWNAIAEIICEDQGFALVDSNPSETLIDRNLPAIAFGKGTNFTFKQKGNDEIRHGLIYLRHEGTIMFIEARQGAIPQ